MAFSYIGEASAAVTGANEITCNRPPGIVTGNIVVAVYAFEGVAAGSGPWIIPNIGQLITDYIGPYTGWQQAAFQAPSAAGVGIEVWWAIHGSGTDQIAKFVANQNCVSVCTGYSGEYNPTHTVNPDTVRLSPSQQVVGNAPPAPAVTANLGELIIACGGDLMAAGFGTPSGFTNRVDVNRAGAGTVEATIADAVALTAGGTGPITFPSNASAAATAGATATLAIRPAPATTGVGPILDAPMPPDLDLADGWTLRVTAIDPATGAVVSGVNVSNLAIECVNVGSGDNSQLAFGDWQLVPGTGA